MPRTEAANQHRRSIQREKILDAARKVFARKGMEATMGEVAAEASISQGLAYHYFVSKEALFQALLEQVLQVSPSGWRHVLEMPGSSGERLALLIERLVQARREYPEIYQILDQVKNAEATPFNLRERFHQQSQTFYEVMRQLIIEGQAEGSVAAGDPEQLVTAFVACFEGLTRLALQNPEQFKQSCPDASIFLRMLQPEAHQQRKLVSPPETHV